ncbi:MAG: ArnT family glycosyltransferase [Anaerolineaceae bacterium]
MPFYQILLILLITAALDWLLLRLWRRWKDKGRPLRWPSINKQWIFLISGLFLLVAAQIVMNLEDPLIWDKNFANFLKTVNDGIRFDIDRRENIFIAVLLLIGGVILFFQAYKPGKSTEPAIESPIFEILPEKSSRIPKSFLLTAILGFFLFIILTVRMFLLQVSLLDPILWLLVLALAGFAIASREKQIRGGIPAWTITRTDVILLILLVAGGLLVSSFRLTTHPNMLMGDEGNFFDTARSIAVGEYLPSFFDMGVYSYPVASSYWQGLIMNWFGVSLWSWRFSSVLIAVLTIIPLYLLGLEMFGRRTAVLASICFLAAPYFLAFARLGYNNSQAMLAGNIERLVFLQRLEEPESVSHISRGRRCRAWVSDVHRCANRIYPGTGNPGCLYNASHICPISTRRSKNICRPDSCFYFRLPDHSQPSSGLQRDHESIVFSLQDS